MKNKLILWWNALVARVVGLVWFTDAGWIAGRYGTSKYQIPVPVSPEEMTHLYGGYGPEGWKQECERVECYIKKQHPARNANRQTVEE